MSESTDRTPGTRARITVGTAVSELMPTDHGQQYEGIVVAVCDECVTVKRIADDRNENDPEFVAVDWDNVAVLAERMIGKEQPPARNLELWPALLPEEVAYPTFPDEDGNYTVAEDAIGGDKKPGWVVRLTPNPAFDPVSRDRVAWVYGAGPALWQMLRDVIRLVPDLDRRDELYGRAARLLGNTAMFAPFVTSQTGADKIRENVNEETLFRLNEAAEKEADHVDDT